MFIIFRLGERPQSRRKPARTHSRQSCARPRQICSHHWRGFLEILENPCEIIADFCNLHKTFHQHPYAVLLVGLSLSLSLPAFLSVCLSVFLSFFLSFVLSLCLSLSLYFSFSCSLSSDVPGLPGLLQQESALLARGARK